MHSDVVTDGLVDLLDSGAVRRGAGTVVASMAVGTKRLFDRLHEPQVDFRPLERLADPVTS